MIEKALEFMEKKHDGQKRRVSGERYTSHTRKVFQILLEVTVDEEILIAGLLHDTIEDTDTTYDELKDEFGLRVADLVLECTRPFDTLHSKEALMIKAADTLHNASEQPTEKWVEKVCDSVRFKG